MEITNPLVKKFKDFIETEIDSAYKELEKIKSEANRKHLQRLVYVNLINRFDSLVDSLLLEFSIKESKFKRKVLDETKEEPVFLRDVYEILLSENPRSAVEERVENVTRLHFLNQRHSSKLWLLLRECYGMPDTDLQRPRVFVNDGSIFENIKRQTPHKTPDTIIGYADWLYSRRNAIVHSDVPKYLKGDLQFMEKRFGVKLANSISLKITSIKSASNFYLSLLSDLIIDKNLSTDDI